MKIFRTSDMEAAVAQMSKANFKTMIYPLRLTLRSINFRHAKYDGVENIQIASAWQPASLSTIARWEKYGGVLEYRPHVSMFKKSVSPNTEALLLVECPLQITVFDYMRKNVSHEVVVYRPPTWILHEEAINALYPGKEAYIALVAVVQALEGRELTAVQQGCVDMVGDNYVAYSAADMEQLLGWSETRLRKVLYKKFPFGSARYTIYATRFTPEDPDLLWAYNLIKAQPEPAPGYYAFRSNFPMAGNVSGFRRMLKRLVREKFVTKEDAVYLQDPACRIDYEKIDAVNNMFRGRWFKMKALIDRAPEYLS